jgi:hypothetical protein
LNARIISKSNRKPIPMDTEIIQEEEEASAALYSVVDDEEVSLQRRQIRDGNAIKKKEKPNQIVGTPSPPSSPPISNGQFDELLEASESLKDKDKDMPTSPSSKLIRRLSLTKPKRGIKPSVKLLNNPVQSSKADAEVAAAESERESTIKYLPKREKTAKKRTFFQLERSALGLEGKENGVDKEGQEEKDYNQIIQKVVDRVLLLPKKKLFISPAKQKEDQSQRPRTYLPKRKDPPKKKNLKWR